MNLERETQITDRLHEKAGIAKIPLSGTFELTPLCNMNCKMCYVTMTPEEQRKRGRLRTKEEWLALAEEARKEGMLFLLLTGGEPFLWPEFRELYQELHKMGFYISINSNGTLIDENTVQWLQKYPPNRINITLYGSSDETYERMCGKKDGHSKVTKAISLLTEAGITVKLNCSLTPFNVDDLEEMVAFAEERELILEVASYMFPPIRKDENMVGENQRFTPEEAAKKMIKTEILQNGEERFRYFLLNNQFPAIERKECVEVEGDCIRCRAGRSSFWVTWDFHLLACGMMPMPKTQLKPGMFKQCWEYIYEEVEHIRTAPECQICPIKMECQTCAAITLSETGRFDQKPNYRCQVMDAYVEICGKLKEDFDLWKGRL